MSKWILFWGSVLLALASKAQSIDSIQTIYLGDVIIYEDLMKQAEIGLSETKIDSAWLALSNGSNISDLLRNTAAGQIRSYGTNGPTSPSFRGTSANHTAILWNGINLQSPLTGGQDLSLLPNGMVNELILQKGGTSSLYGSGAIGGSIQLNNQTYFDRGLEIGSQQKIGSFGNYYQSYEVDWSNKTANNSTLFFKRTMDNDYPYVNINSRSTRRLYRTNAAINQWGVLQQNDWQINAKHLIGIKLWIQDNHIETPNVIFAADNESYQNDQFLRGLLNWDFAHEKFTFNYKQALFLHHLLFVQSERDQFVNNYSSWIHRMAIDFEPIRHTSMTIGTNINLEGAEVDAFGSNRPSRRSIALFTSARSKILEDKLLLALNLRQELVNDELTPFLPSFGVDYQLLKKLKLKGNVSKNYRLPTFNDLYWLGAGAIGNTDLKPETSINYELGMHYQWFKTPSKYSLLSSVTAYHYLVDDWVQWREEKIGSTWTPVNLKQVLSQGLESKLSGQYQTKPFLFAMDLMYNYTKTINKKIYDDIISRELNMQLMYTPLNEASMSLKAGYKNWLLIANHTYTGLQHTDGGNNPIYVVKAYQVTNVSFSNSFQWKKMKVGLQFEINNVLDVHYENRRGYPMYGRNYSIGLEINFKNKP